MSDLISREGLLHAIDEKYPPRFLTPSEATLVSWICEMIQAFPSAEPKKGHWDIEISADGYQATYRCSECGHQFRWIYDSHFPPVFNYCQKCGARMNE